MQPYAPVLQPTIGSDTSGSGGLLPPEKRLLEGASPTLRYVDWIWHVRGSLPLAPEQSSDDTFEKLAPLFRQYGTKHHRTDEDTLMFTKKDQAAQDKMSVFDSGVLRIERSAAGSTLRYRLMSRALLFCFLVPLLFLGIAQLTIFVSKFEKPAEAADKTGKGSEEAKKKLAKANLPMNPIDKALGAPAPDKPKKKAADKAKEDDEKSSPTPAYVFAAIFALLYVVGRVLEARLVKSLFAKTLSGSASS